jgi:putative toxin-antitoxin system antitoxin component (TIGR02293 family)
MGSIARNRRSQAQLTLARADHPRAKASGLGLKAANAESLIRQVEAGFPFSILERFVVRSGIAISDIASIAGIPPRTLARRKASGKFTWDESERLLRIALVFEKAVELFEGNIAAAASWVLKPRKALGHRSPLAYSRTEVGAREVENLIGRLEHGVFS